MAVVMVGVGNLMNVLPGSQKELRRILKLSLMGLGLCNLLWHAGAYNTRALYLQHHHLNNLASYRSIGGQHTEQCPRELT